MKPANTLPARPILLMANALIVLKAAKCDETDQALVRLFSLPYSLRKQPGTALSLASGRANDLPSAFATVSAWALVIAARPRVERWVWHIGVSEVQTACYEREHIGLCGPRFANPLPLIAA
jgi:hypothetical protein